MLSQLSALWGVSVLTIFLLGLLMLWDSVWKAIALWKSGRNKQPVWFICLFIFNTVGLLPIIYLLFFQKKRAVIGKRSRRKRR